MHNHMPVTCILQALKMIIGQTLFRGTENEADAIVT